MHLELQRREKRGKSCIREWQQIQREHLITGSQVNIFFEWRDQQEDLPVAKYRKNRMQSCRCASVSQAEDAEEYVMAFRLYKEEQRKRKKIQRELEEKHMTEKEIREKREKERKQKEEYDKWEKEKMARIEERRRQRRLSLRPTSTRTMNQEQEEKYFSAAEDKRKREDPDEVDEDEDNVSKKRKKKRKDSINNRNPDVVIERDSFLNKKVNKQNRKKVIIMTSKKINRMNRKKQ